MAIAHFELLEHCILTPWASLDLFSSPQALGVGNRLGRGGLPLKSRVWKPSWLLAYESPSILRSLYLAWLLV